MKGVVRPELYLLICCVYCTKHHMTQQQLSLLNDKVRLSDHIGVPCMCSCTSFQLSATKLDCMLFYYPNLKGPGKGPYQNFLEIDFIVVSDRGEGYLSAGFSPMGKYYS